MGYGKLNTPEELQSLLRSELSSRLAFKPVGFQVVVPSTWYWHESKSDHLPNNPLFLRACDELMEHGGYIRIDGADQSSVFVEVENI